MKYLQFWTATSNVPLANDANNFATLADNTTYYADLGLHITEWCGLLSMQWDWASLVATITVDATNHYDAPLTEATGARWIDIAAIADVLPNGTSQDIASWADAGYGRMRAKIVVGAVAGNGGTLRGAFHAKKRSN